ncbi:sugar transferase [Flavobacterium sp. CYK-4]|uniref:sugar transferase n=1 Tax=Flavobacterium lotistagni TaxID=2709660 RepID=UPI00140BACCB|nr:sugar transferase [Flavobacterium lotistagni]NHM06423.1 sugar transferase [Flavobacterium lotistagni]
MKRIFDIVFSIIALILTGWLILICYLIASIETQSNGLFVQPRVGQFGKLFTIYKLRTMHPKTEAVTFLGKYFRRYKLDELPQFYNVLIGEMSVVGPRPDVPGYYDQLVGEERKILELKPGITSEASLKYYNEDALLAQQAHPQEYNDTVLFPDKVKLNLEYYYRRSFGLDLNIIWRTIF